MGARYFAVALPEEVDPEVSEELELDVLPVPLVLPDMEPVLLLDGEVDEELDGGVADVELEVELDGDVLLLELDGVLLLDDEVGGVVELDDDDDVGGGVVVVLVLVLVRSHAATVSATSNTDAASVACLIDLSMYVVDVPKPITSRMDATSLYGRFRATDLQPGKFYGTNERVTAARVRHFFPPPCTSIAAAPRRSPRPIATRHAGMRLATRCATGAWCDPRICRHSRQMRRRPTRRNSMDCRIAMISEHASPLTPAGSIDAGGQNIYVANTARELAALGYRVDVFTRRDADDLEAIVDWRPGIRIVHVPAGPPCFVAKEKLLDCMGDFAQCVVNVANEAESEGDPYRLAHAHFFMSGLVAQRLKSELAVPYVITFHALGRVRLLHQGRDDFPEQRAALEQLVIDHADAVVAECPQDAEDLLRHYRVHSSRLAMVPCGFDPAEFRAHARAAARSALGVDGERPVLLHIGRLVPRKGIDTVIRALNVLRSEYACDPLLMIVGGNDETGDPRTTPEIARLLEIARQEGVDDTVCFVGRRTRAALPLYFSAADVFVTTPWYEPFGITVVEAMAAGLPVVGSKVGGVQYTVLDGETGFLVPARDPAALARRLGQLIASPTLRRMFGRRGRRRAYQQFTWQGIAQRLDALYVGVTRSESRDLAASAAAGA